MLSSARRSVSPHQHYSSCSHTSSIPLLSELEKSRDFQRISFIAEGNLEAESPGAEVTVESVKAMEALVDTLVAEANQALIQVPELPPEQSFVSRLPVDALVNIFLLLSSTEFDNDLPRHRNYSPPGSSNAKSTQGLALPTLSLVCRKWRSVILFSPLLWNHIYIPEYNEDRLKVYLKRSTDVPLYLFIDFSNCNPKRTQILSTRGLSASVKNVLAPHFHRVTRWDIRPKHLGDFETFYNLVTSSYPDTVAQLDMLTLQSSDSIYTRHGPDALLAFPDVSARTLRLLDVKPNPSWGSWASITKLIILRDKLEIDRVFVDIMSMCSGSLEELVLHVTRVSVKLGRTNNSDEVIPRITLTSLKKFVFHCDLTRCAEIFQYLNIPRSAYWEILHYQTLSPDLSVLTAYIPMHNKVRVILHESLSHQGFTASGYRFNRPFWNERLYLWLRSDGSSRNNGTSYIDVIPPVHLLLSTILPRTALELSLEVRSRNKQIFDLDAFRLFLEQTTEVRSLTVI